MIVFGLLYKLGVFGSVWGFAKGTALISILLVILYRLNTSKEVEIDGEKKLIPKVLVFSDDENQSYYTMWMSILCMVVLFITFLAM